VQKDKLILEILSCVPKGRVATYKMLAQMARLGNAARFVGNVLHKNKHPRLYPCHRVISTSGRLAQNYAFGGKKAQEEKLKKEGINIQSGRVDLKKYLWKPTRTVLLYFELLKRYADPGPWPWFGSGKKSTKEEIAIGAILTQNTNWRNVEKALDNLRKENLSSIAKIYALGKKNPDQLKMLIKPSGYYNQKARRLFEFCRFIVEEYQELKNLFQDKDAREKLLALWGIGEETTDTILLYAGNRPYFVIDAYTKRFVKAHDLTEATKYKELQEFFMKTLPQNVRLYQKYHALIVRWGKGRA
jgi:endonuclease-3 related protein